MALKERTESNRGAINRRKQAIVKIDKIIKQTIIFREISGDISSREQEQSAMTMKHKIINCSWKLNVRLLILKTIWNFRINSGHHSECREENIRGKVEDQSWRYRMEENFPELIRNTFFRRVPLHTGKNK